MTMSGIRSASWRLRSLTPLYSFRLAAPGSSFRPTSSGSGNTSGSTLAPGDPEKHESRIKRPSALLVPPSVAGVRGAASSGARAVDPKMRKQMAVEFQTSADAVEEEEGTGDSTFSGPYLLVSIRCCKRDADSLSDALLCFGAASATMDELSDFGDVDEICISSIFTIDQDVHMCICNAAKSIDLDKTPNYEVTVSEQYDWINNVKETFNPVQVTDGLWVVPEWRKPPDIKATNIILNPGIAFGTGDHPTTKLCLLLLHSLVTGGENFLDYGTGSGILGIAALKMGAALSVGVDIDPQALAAARQNIALNEIDPVKMQLFLATGKELVADQTQNRELYARKGMFDIIVANILLNPLLELSEELTSYGKPGAIVGVSGIISEQIPEVKERYSEYLESICTSEMDGWACLSGTKRRNL